MQRKKRFGPYDPSVRKLARAERDYCPASISLARASLDRHRRDRTGRHLFTRSPSIGIAWPKLTPSAGGEPTVTLTADASPFEAVLDKAADKVSGWGSRIESRMGALAENIRGRTAKIADALASVNEKVDAGADIAGSIGSVIGGAAGAWAGPVGILIGKQLGEGLSRTLADSIDFGDALSGANSLKAGIDAQVEDAKDSFAGLKFSIGKRFEEIRGIIGELNLSDIIAGDADNAEKKFDELAGRVGEKVEEMIGQSMARIGDFIDRAFERVKEPLATVVEAIQAVAQHFGLAEQGAESWGDSIRSIPGDRREGVHGAREGARLRDDGAREGGRVCDEVPCRAVAQERPAHHDGPDGTVEGDGETAGSGGARGQGDGDGARTERGRARQDHQRGRQVGGRGNQQRLG